MVWNRIVDKEKRKMEGEMKGRFWVYSKKNLRFLGALLSQRI